MCTFYVEKSVGSEGWEPCETVVRKAEKVVREKLNLGDGDWTPGADDLMEDEIHEAQYKTHHYEE